MVILGHFLHQKEPSELFSHHEPIPALPHRVPQLQAATDNTCIFSVGFPGLLSYTNAVLLHLVLVTRCFHLACIRPHLLFSRSCCSVTGSPLPNILGHTDEFYSVALYSGFTSHPQRPLHGESEIRKANISLGRLKRLPSGKS